MPWIRTVALADLPVGELVQVDAGEEDLIVCRPTAAEIFALENCCSHDDAPLDEGELDGREVVCPRHGARFDVATGAVLKMPAPTGIAAYPVRISPEGWVEIEVED
ncbi:MAG: Rieske 2Fe-2S domain-containing protein [Candidatus Krumholzibacteriia bacterium]